MTYKCDRKISAGVGKKPKHALTNPYTHYVLLYVCINEIEKKHIKIAFTRNEFRKRAPVKRFATAYGKSVSMNLPLKLL